MPEPIHRGGTWWHEQADGSWLRFDEASGQWSPSSSPPPPPGPGDLAQVTTETPAPAAPGGVYRPNGGYKPLSRRADWAVRLLIAAMVMGGVAVVSDLAEISFIEKVRSGDFSSQAEAFDAAEANDDRQGTVGGIQFVVLLAAGILFLRWFRAAYENLGHFGARKRFGSGWAIGGWFVPFANFVIPKQVMDDIWRGADAPPAADRAAAPGEPSVHPIVHWWWAAWLTTSLTGWWFWRWDPKTLDQIRAASIVNTISDAMTIIAAVLLIRIIRIATARLEARAAPEIEGPANLTR